MLMLTLALFASFTFGFAFPPLWIVTFLAGRAIYRRGRAVQAAQQAYFDRERQQALMWFAR